MPRPLRHFQSAVFAYSILFAPPVFAQEHTPLHPDLLAAIENAKDKQDLLVHMARATAPVMSDICTQPDWEAVNMQITASFAFFKAHGMTPSVSRAQDDGAVHFFAWGPVLDDPIERLNPDLGYINLNFWFTVEMIDWGTHRALHCKYAALDYNTENTVLRIASKAFLSRMPELSETASHVAPMLHQVPDKIRTHLLQSTDRNTQVELRQGGGRLDVVMDRRFAED